MLLKWLHGYKTTIKATGITTVNVECGHGNSASRVNVKIVLFFHNTAINDFNHCRAQTAVDERLADVLIHSNGGVFWISHKNFQSACIVDLTHYPYDIHTCDLWFQSLVYPSNEVILEVYSPGIDLETQLSSFRESDEWEVVANSSEVIHTPRDEGEQLVFSRRRSLRKRLVLRRRPGFTALLVTLPCVVLSAMTTLVYLIPPQRTDRHLIGQLENQLGLDSWSN